MSGVPVEETFSFRNYYTCPSRGHVWASIWPHTCDDDCPQCGRGGVSPSRSEDVPPMQAPPRLAAVFRPQAWINDYAVDIVGAVQFDATAALLNLSLHEIQKFREHSDDSDALAEDLPAQKQHSGPFEVDVDIDGWLADNGIEHGRAKLTQEELETLRRRFLPLERSPESPPAATRRVRIRLAAMIRHDWEAVVEVPADAADEELHELARQFQQDIDGGEYLDDNEYWEDLPPAVETDVTADEPAQYRADRDQDGDLAYTGV